MFFRFSGKNAQPLPEKIAVLMREARWLLMAVLGVYVAMILFGFNKADPGWSHAVSVVRVHNPGGSFGAWLADLLLHLWGSSAWWLVLFLFWGLLFGRQVKNAWINDRRPLFVVLCGLLLLLLSSCALEALRFHSSRAALPGAPGGVIGLELSDLAMQAFGFTGATMLLLALWATGLSIFGGFSWVNVLERCGLGLERAGLWCVAQWQTWQDRKVGQVQAVQREEKVKTARKKRESAEPVMIHIEPVEPVVSEKRVAKVAQPSLFGELPVGALPALALLDPPSNDVAPPSMDSLEYTSRLIETKLADFGVEVKVLAAYPGPVITRYEIEPATGVKGSQVVNLVKDLARALSVMSIRVVETIPGKACMGLEIPNVKRQTVRLSEIIDSQAYRDSSSALTVVLGKDIGGNPLVADLAKMPHLLVAGTTGSGKSVGINAMILSLLYKSEPDKVRLIMIDPKMLELSIYEGIPHLLAPVVTDMRHAGHALNWCVGEMDRRYKLMAAVGVRNLAGFNKHVAEAKKQGKPLTNPFSLTPETPEPLEVLPSVVVIIDELADLMMVMGKKIEELIARLAQKARASGIHLVLATQRPSVDVITGLIKANVPTRMSFQVSSKIDSRTILDQMGAESLLGMGDMLYLAPGTGLPTRAHGAFVDDREVHKVVEYLKTTGEPNYIDGMLTGETEVTAGMGDLLGDSGGEGGAEESDGLYDQAVEIVLKTRRPSISLVQRHLRIGYNRAARLIEQMEKAGLVSSMGSGGSREVLAPVREE